MRSALSASCVNTSRIIAENLHRNIGFDSRYGFVKAHCHGLSEVRGDPGNFARPFGHGADQALFVVRGRPFRHRFEEDVDIGLIDTHRLRCQVGPAHFSHDASYLREPEHSLLDF